MKGVIDYSDKVDEVPLTPENERTFDSIEDTQSRHIEIAPLYSNEVTTTKEHEHLKIENISSDHKVLCNNNNDASSFRGYFPVPVPEPEPEYVIREVFDMNGLIEVLKDQIKILPGTVLNKSSLEEDCIHSYVKYLLDICDRISKVYQQSCPEGFAELCIKSRREIDTAVKEKEESLESLQKLSWDNYELNAYISEIENSHHKNVGELMTEIELANWEKLIYVQHIEDLKINMKAVQSVIVDNDKRSKLKFWKRKSKSSSDINRKANRSKSFHLSDLSSSSFDIFAPPPTFNPSSIFSYINGMPNFSDTKSAPSVQLRQLANNCIIESLEKKSSQLAELQVKYSELEQAIAPHISSGTLNKTSEENILKESVENIQIENQKLKADESQCYDLMKNTTEFLKEKVEDMELLKEDVKHSREFCRGQQELLQQIDLTVFEKCRKFQNEKSSLEDTMRFLYFIINKHHPKGSECMENLEKKSYEELQVLLEDSLNNALNFWSTDTTFKDSFVQTEADDSITPSGHNGTEYIDKYVQTDDTFLLSNTLQTNGNSPSKRELEEMEMNVGVVRSGRPGEKEQKSSYVSSIGIIGPEDISIESGACEENRDVKMSAEVDEEKAKIAKYKKSNNVKDTKSYDDKEVTREIEKTIIDEHSVHHRTDIDGRVVKDIITKDNHVPLFTYLSNKYDIDSNNVTRRVDDDDSTYMDYVGRENSISQHDYATQTGNQFEPSTIYEDCCNHNHEGNQRMFFSTPHQNDVLRNYSLQNRWRLRELIGGGKPTKKLCPLHTDKRIHNLRANALNIRHDSSTPHKDCEKIVLKNLRKRFLESSELEENVNPCHKYMDYFDTVSSDLKCRSKRPSHKSTRYDHQEKIKDFVADFNIIENNDVTTKMERLEQENVMLKRLLKMRNNKLKKQSGEHCLYGRSDYHHHLMTREPEIHETYDPRSMGVETAECELDHPRSSNKEKCESGGSEKISDKFILSYLTAKSIFFDINQKNPLQNSNGFPTWGLRD